MAGDVFPVADVAAELQTRADIRSAARDLQAAIDAAAGPLARLRALPLLRMMPAWEPGILALINVQRKNSDLALLLARAVGGEDR